MSNNTNNGQGVSLVLISINMLILFLLIRFHYSSPYDMAMEAKSKKDLNDMLKTLTDVLESANITYFMQFGTLLGAYRHHGPIPWDDDNDVMVNYTQKRDIIKAMTSLQPKYGLYQQTDSLFKLYANGGWPVFLKAGLFKWPYVDIFFFGENSTHIWDLTYNSHHNSHYKHYKFPEPHSVYRKSDVFPLQKRPFSKLNLYAPCNTEKLLRQTYNNINICKSSHYSHR